MPQRFLTEADQTARHGPLRPNSRLLLLIIAGCLWAGAVASRLVYLAIIRHHAYHAMAQRQQERLIEIAPQRGTITDRNGNVLAVSLPVESCFAIPREIKNKSFVARMLAGPLQTPAKDILARIDNDRTFAWVARRLPPDVVERINAMNLTGIYFTKEMERFYPNRQLAAQVLGFVDIDGHGQAGIEYGFDKEISGQPGQLSVLADGNGHYFQPTERPPVPGAAVQLTIDENIQYMAEKALAEAVEENHADGGSILVMKPSTGELLAMANWPTFDPNLPSEATPAERQNRAISDIYEPGSTFKTITLSAAVDDGVVTPDEDFDCGMGHIVLAGRLIHDWHPFGILTVSQVLMNSSDVGAIKIALKLGDDKLYDYMRAYGFGRKSGIRLPWESPGMLRPPRLWTASSIGSLAMGQEIGVTTLQLIDAVSAIANGGLLHAPRIIRQMDEAGHEVAPPVAPPTRVISSATSAAMRHMMEEVVLGGTGRHAQLDGYTTAGKTGTAQKVDPVTHLYSHTNYMASFIGYAPINDPAVVTLVVIDTPRMFPLYKREGAWAAAPAFKIVMEQVLNYLGVPRDLPITPPPGAPKLLRASLSSPSLKQSKAKSIAPPAWKQTATLDSKPAPPPPGMFAMPDLSGETVRQATEQCVRLGLAPRVAGTGIAVDQQPPAGAFVRTGARVSVRFALRPNLAPTKAGGGHAP